MLRCLVRSNTQRLVVTDKDLRYDGSRELDSRPMRASDILPDEIVQWLDVNNGSRFETYVIAAPSGSGARVLKGAAVRLSEVGDELIIMSLAWLAHPESRQHRLTRVNVDHGNHIRKSDRNSARCG